MSPRPYQLGKRTASVIANREQILTATIALMTTRGFHELSVDEVAKRADVARGTIYHQFGTKLGLLDAVLEYTAHQSGIHSVHHVVQLTDSREALFEFLHAITHFWENGRHVFRNVVGLGFIDTEVGSLIESKDLGRQRTIEHLVDRLQHDNNLVDEITKQRAVDSIWLYTSFPTFEQLRVRSALGVDETAELLQTLVGRALLQV